MIANFSAFAKDLLEIKLDIGPFSVGDGYASIKFEHKADENGLVCFVQQFVSLDHLKEFKKQLDEALSANRN